MKKIEEYKVLNKKVRDARRKLNAAKSQITEVIKTPDWEEYCTVIKCINRYSGMVMPWFSKNSFENIEFVKYCESFDCHHLCENNNCPYEEKNWDAVAAQFAYDDAIAARRAFVRGLLRIRRR